MGESFPRSHVVQITNNKPSSTTTTTSTSVSSMDRQTLPPAKPATAPPSRPAAIQSAYPYFRSAFSFLIPATLALYRVLVQIASKVFKPIILLSPIPVVLYILAPVFAFCNVLLDVLVLMPIKTILYLLDAFYPLYVFCGVACITGCLLGLGAKYMSNVLVKMVTE